MYYLLRDGKIIEEFNSENKAWERLLKIQPMSTDWAIKHEGWEILDEETLYERKVQFLENYGLDESEVLEDDEGEFVILENQNYAHPTDEGASTDFTKTYITYEGVDK